LCSTACVIHNNSLLKEPCSCTTVPDGPHDYIRNILRVKKEVTQISMSKISLKFPGKEAPPHVPLTGSLWREMFRLQSQWFIHSYLLGVRKQEPSHEMGKNISSPFTEPHSDGSSTYSGVQAGSKRGSLTTLLSLPQCLAAFSTIPSTLAWVDQSPVSQRVSL